MKVLALVAVIAAASCAGKQPQPAQAPATAPASGAELAPDPHSEIKRYVAEIDSASAKLGLAAPEPLPGTPSTPMGSMATQGDASCKPAANDTCKTSCTLSDSICDNADKICRLAAELPGDRWALDRCTQANATCKAARAKCCSCR